MILKNKYRLKANHITYSSRFNCMFGSHDFTNIEDVESNK